MIACQVFSFLSALFCVCVICEKQLAHGDLLDQQGCNFKKEKKKEKKITHFIKVSQINVPCQWQIEPSLFLQNMKQFFFVQKTQIFPAFMNVEKFLYF